MEKIHGKPGLAKSFKGSAALGIALAVSSLATRSLAQTYEVVHRFRNSEATTRPDEGASQSRLIVATDGYLYGTTYWGGQSGFGTIYRMDSAGTTTTIHSFAFADGANSAAGLVRSSDGSFYGTTNFGGAHNRGTVFRMDTSGAVTRLHSFDGDDGQYPLAALIPSSDGMFYGTTSAGGVHGDGTVFRVASSGEFASLHSFDRWVDGARPVAELLEARGAFYGTTREGGANNLGTAFRMDFAGDVTTIGTFTGAAGQHPVAAVISSTTGDLYGTASQGGANGAGAVFRIDAADQVTTLHSFDWSTEGSTPLAPLVQATDGNFYGTAWAGAGALDKGTIFRMTDSGTVTLLHAFDATDGARPAVGLVETPGGDLVGTTNSANLPFLDQVAGTVFRIDSGGSFATLQRFGWQDGRHPAFLLPASDGFIYGTTAEGGPNNQGTIFRIDPAGEVRLLHDLEGGLDGKGPARLLQASDGTIFGTDEGGANGLGRIFRLDASGDTTTLHSFEGADGAGPTGLVEAADGKLYGTARYGGFDGHGTFFRIDTSGAFESLGVFSPDGNGLGYPNGPLLEYSGKFFGTTSEGGHGLGCIFEASTDSGPSIQYCFAFDGSQGAYPLTPLTNSDGDLWGTTSEAGEFGLGTAFLTLPGWFDLDTKHSFTDGEGPCNSLTIAGGLYGTTGYASQSPKGTIFEMDDAGNLTTIYDFPGEMDGGYPSAPVRASDGLLYGTADLIYRLSKAKIAANQILPSSGSSTGGEALIVMGGGFGGNASVTVGGASGADLTVLDSTFLYLFTPPLSPGTLNDVSVTVPDAVGTAMATLPKAFFADFLDVPPIHPFHDFVEKIFRKGITAGCAAGSYCPDDPVTRAQMAVFLLKSEHGSTYVPPPCAGVFADVSCPSTFADWIEQLGAEGITAGCGGGDYCPANPVTRAQVAVFLLKTKHGVAYLPPACTGVFGDVACPGLFADWIEQLAAEQITGGCGSGDYCPESPNTRGQMAVFLVKTFGL